MKRSQLTKLACKALLLGSLLCGRVSQASIFGEENVQLMLLVAQGMEQAKRVQETIEYMQETSRYARETAAFAQNSLQTVRHMQTLLDNPTAFFDEAMQTWQQEFPALKDVLVHAHALQQSMQAAAQPHTAAFYDPHVYVRALQQLQALGSSSFEVWAHAADKWGINRHHDATLKIVQTEYDAALKNFEKLAAAVNSTGLSAIDAAVYTAQASSAAAMAQVQAAATLEHMSRTVELLVTGQAAQQAKDAALSQVQAAGVAEVYMRSWRLDPGQARRLGHEFVPEDKNNAQQP